MAIGGHQIALFQEIDLRTDPTIIQAGAIEIALLAATAIDVVQLQRIASDSDAHILVVESQRDSNSLIPDLETITQSRG